MHNDASMLEVRSANVAPLVHKFHGGIWCIGAVSWWIMMDDPFREYANNDTTRREHLAAIFACLREGSHHEAPQKFGMHRLDENTYCAVDAETRILTRRSE